MMWTVNETPDPCTRLARVTERWGTMEIIFTVTKDCLFFQPWTTRGKKTLRFYLQDEVWWEKRNVFYISKANKNGSVPGDMLVWDKLPLTPMDFSGHIQLEMDYSIFRREPLPFPLSASPTRCSLSVRLIKKNQTVSGCFADGTVSPLLSY